MLKRRLFGAAFFGAVAVITYLSLSTLPFETPDLGFDAVDKLGHSLAYAVTMILGCLLWSACLRDKQMIRPHFLILGFALFGYGIIIEVLQYLLPVNRWAELWDIAANGIGIMTGGIIFQILFKKSSVKKA